MNKFLAVLPDDERSTFRVAGFDLQDIGNADDRPLREGAAHKAGPRGDKPQQAACIGHRPVGTADLEHDTNPFTSRASSRRS
ncbi:MAG: hypothetical protein M5U33_00590 [Pseudorhodoplanes sp.]|nr:hypothetical protein [Pseudorhodoplanes sp.]